MLQHPKYGINSYMYQQECSEKIAAGLKALGVLPEDTILVHSAFKSLGPVPGGIETVVQGLLQAIGPQGTLLMPALTWALRPPEIFNGRMTPTNLGAIPEYFRTRAGTCRSIHPTHSVCATGRRTEELLADHHLDSTPCGPHSPFHKLLETNGKIIMLGCGLAPNTTMHALEEYVMPPFLLGQSYVFTITDKQGHTYQKEYRTHGFRKHGYSQKYERVAQLNTRAFMSQGLVIQAPTFVLDAPTFKNSVLEKMKADPFFFVNQSIDS